MIYLDNNATTPLRASVKDVMMKHLDTFGNPSAVYAAGREARLQLDEAHRTVGAYFNVRAEQVVFTSGGTESDVMAIVGLLESEKASALITTKSEHPAILETALKMKRRGRQVHFISVDENGLISEEELKDILQEQEDVKALVSIMYAHNETGVIQNIKEISSLCKKYEAILHIDAVQAVGKLSREELDFVALGADMLSVSFHKFGGPKGVGALILKSEQNMEPLLTGGSQERSRRAGTENTLAIIAAGEAVRCLQNEKAFKAEQKNICKLNERLEKGLKALGGNELKIIGEKAKRTGATTSFVFEGVDAEMAILSLDMAGIAISRGSACSSGRTEPSKALLATGLSESEAKSALRVSLAWHNTAEDIDAFLAAYAQVLERRN